MSAVYANKFTLQINDVARIVCIDERVPIAEGLPMASSTSAEVVMTFASLKALHDMIGTVLKKMEGIE